MTTYLDMTATNASVVTTLSQAADYVEMDVIFSNPQKNAYGYILGNTNIRINNNSLQFGTGVTGFAMGTRTTMTIDLVTNGATQSTLCLFYRGTTGAGYDGYSCTGYVYDVKYYVGGKTGTLIAHYDMTTGTAIDQSGNGNDGIVNNATFISDGTGTSTTYSGSGSVNGQSTVLGSDTVVLSETGAINGQSSLSSNPKIIETSSGNIQGVATVSGASQVINHSTTTYNGSGVASGTSIFQGSPKIVAKVVINVNSMGTMSGQLGYDQKAAGNIQGQSVMIFKDPTSTHISVLNFQGSLSLPINLVGTTSPDIQLLGSFNDMSFLGSKNPDISLKGGI